MEIRIDFTRYRGILPQESHAHSQLVLALEGGMEIEIAGKAGNLDQRCGVFVPSGFVHSQDAHKKNQFLVLNCDENVFGAPLADYLADTIFLPVSPAAKQLIDFAEKARQEQIFSDALSSHWAHLLIGSLAPHTLGASRSRLAKLAAIVEKSLDHPWSVQEMADKAGLSASRLHAVFQAEWSTAPQEWLTALRVEKAQQWLANSDISIAELAQVVGYSDQSSLTRSMRRLKGITPATYRRQQRESRSK